MSTVDTTQDHGDARDDVPDALGLAHGLCGEQRQREADTRGLFERDGLVAGGRKDARLVAAGADGGDQGVEDTGRL